MLKSIYAFTAFNGCIIKTFCDFNVARTYAERGEKYYFGKTGHDIKCSIGKIGIGEYPALFKTDWKSESDKVYPKTVYLLATENYASKGGCPEMAFEKLADAAAFAELFKTETFIEEMSRLSKEDVKKLFENQDELDLIISMFGFEKEAL